LSLYTAGRVYRFSRYMHTANGLIYGNFRLRILIKQKHRAWNIYKETESLEVHQLESVRCSPVRCHIPVYSS